MGYDLSEYRLYGPDGVEVREGETIKDFRGDPAKFVRITKAPTENSGGKIEVRGRGERFPSVFRSEIRRAEN